VRGAEEDLMFHRRRGLERVGEKSREMSVV